MQARAPDFLRNVHCVLGLPVDAISEAQAAAIVRQAAAAGRRCWLSTPNLNFAIGCSTDAEFRDTVLRSDLSIADGWPLVAAARLAGTVLPGRASGAGVFERLCVEEAPPLGVFFFGGPSGAARTACERTNATARGVVCVGHAEAGWGDAADLGSPRTIEAINASGAGLLSVSLGAKKGQTWIALHAAALTVPVLVHLGAVVNFAAGAVKRAPLFFQRMRLEWLWRIGQEPALWRRYAHDGRMLIGWWLGRLLPLWLARQVSGMSGAQRTSFDMRTDSREDGTSVLRLVGDCSGPAAPELRRALADLVEQGRPVTVDLGAATDLGSAVLGLLLLLHGWQRAQGIDRTVGDASPIARGRIRQLGAQYLFGPQNPR